MTSSLAQARILIVDDSESTLEVLERNLVRVGYRVFRASAVAEAIETLKGTSIDLVITDLKMPRISGMDLVQHVKDNFRNVGIMMITGYPSIESAVQAVKSGAEEYLAKPFTDEELLSAVQRALDNLPLRRAGQTHSLAMLSGPYGLIGQSESMRAVREAILRAAGTPATVLITGESGTGKELVARAIHYNSARASAPFVPVNCGGVPEGLFESELFGHVKGAFTGATDSRAGFFHTADGGTIFLDEISETSFSMQVKLLRALQDREIRMVGSDKDRKVDVRILAATNKDLAMLARKGGFREDLYYRLNVITIAVPPLRERGEDILLLIRHFLEKFAKEAGKPVPRVSERALQRMKSYDWPGNVRELENVMQRLIVMNDGDVLDMVDLPSLMRFAANPERVFTRTLAEVESEYIHNVLASVGGNKSQAASILGIDRKTLRAKLHENTEGS